MNKAIIKGQEAEELKLLYAAMPDAATKAGTALRKHGMDSSEFAEADSNLGKIILRIRAICGDQGW